MDDAYQLHNAARHYCIDRCTRWASEFEESDVIQPAQPGWRYRALDAILMEIETIDSDALPEFSALKELLVLAAHTANIEWSEWCPDIAAAAIEEEREQYAAAIRALTESSIADYAPLPYRRVLSGGEVSSLWERVKLRWGADGRKHYFFPLFHFPEPSLRAFHTEGFNREFPPSRLQSILRSWGISRIYELRDNSDKNYLMSIDLWEPCYMGYGEGYWIADSLDWIMYASHEDSITTGGTLTEAVLSGSTKPLDQW